MKLPSAVRDLQEQAERYNRLVRPTCLDMYEQMERTWAPLRQHFELMEKIKKDSAVFRLQEIAESHQRLTDIAKGAMWIEDIERAHRTWMESIRPLQDSLAYIRGAVEPLAGISHYLTASERLFAGLDFSVISQAYTLPDSFVLQTQKVFTNMTQSYERLAGSIKTLPDLVGLPAYTLPSASREIFTVGYAISRICPVTIETEGEEEIDDALLVKEAEQEVSITLELLRRVNPAFEKPYLGARDAIKSDSADRARHIYASLRELWNHLLRELAPDEKVLGWLPKDKNDFLHKGKPTRKARILYICRGINHAPLTEFIDYDTQSLVKLVELFNQMHELELDISDGQLDALMLRTDSWLMYILRIQEEAR